MKPYVFAQEEGTKRKNSLKMVDSFSFSVMDEILLGVSCG
jgi:hypothetical protein